MHGMHPNTRAREASNATLAGAHEDEAVPPIEVEACLSARLARPLRVTRAASASPAIAVQE